MQLLTRIVDAGPWMPVMVDGGFHRGRNILKALALGARLVFIDRPFNYAVAIAGQLGVTHGIELLRLEIDRNMGLLGVKSFEDLNGEILPKVRRRLFAAGGASADAAFTAGRSKPWICHGRTTRSALMHLGPRPQASRSWSYR